MLLWYNFSIGMMRKCCGSWSADCKCILMVVGLLVRVLDLWSFNLSFSFLSVCPR